MAVRKLKTMTNDKTERYVEMLSQVETFCSGGDNAISVLANCAAVMKVQFPDNYFWVGFYIVDGNELFWGSFQGTPACTRIKYGRGVCGTAWKEQRTLVVSDVNQFPDYIACSSLSRSEIVVPILYGDTIVGEIDIDSTSLSTFDSTDAAYLEKVVCIIAPHTAILAKTE